MSFLPVYTINDWGNNFTFLGERVEKVMASAEKEREANFQLTGPFTAQVMWPDGLITKEKISVKLISGTVRDMGNTYTTNSLAFYIPVKVHGANGYIGIKDLKIDPSTIVYNA